MKKLLLLLLPLLLFCEQLPQPPATPQIITIPNQNPTNPTDPPPAPLTSAQVQFALYTGATTYFYDGLNLVEWKTGPSAYAGNKIMSNNNILYNLDAYGATLSSQQLPGIAYKLKKYNSDIYTIEHLDPATSQAQGSTAIDHIRAWKNYTEIGNWMNNNYLPQDVKITLQGELIAQTGWGQYIDINGLLLNIKWANDLLLYNYDINTKTAIMCDNTNHAVSWTYNYMNNNADWIVANGKYYSSIGYEFNGSALTEAANTLWSFVVAPYPVTLQNPEKPVVSFAGKRMENSEEVLYILEYDSGWLFRYVPSIDSLQQKYRLYIGTNTRIGGMARRGTVKPKIIGNILFFIDNGQIYSMHLDSGIVNLFYAGIGELWVF